MTERDVEKKLQTELGRLPQSVIWKVHDETTGGQPDLDVAWNGNTSKLELKVLRRNEVIHDKWEDTRQLTTCCAYERATQRCWIVAFQLPYVKANRLHLRTIIYRPTSLLRGKVPNVVEFGGLDADIQTPAEIFSRLWTDGGIAFARPKAFDLKLIVDLIRVTHS